MSTCFWKAFWISRYLQMPLPRDLGRGEEEGPKLVGDLGEPLQGPGRADVLHDPGEVETVLLHPLLHQGIHGPETLAREHVGAPVRQGVEGSIEGEVPAMMLIVPVGAIAVRGTFRTRSPASWWALPSQAAKTPRSSARATEASRAAEETIP
ncbi:MAG TPA: hypothetical protein VLL48_10060 [Longimicrobiales bacterium]|nr:hypothetical protein [Longimicrobiales bacterium]